MEGFTDLLDDIKKLGGTLMWVSQKKEFLENTTLHRKKRSPEQLKQDVLQSPRLRYVIDQIVSKSNLADVAATKKFKTTNSKTTLPQVDAQGDLNKSLFKLKQEDVQNEAKQILDEMAHQFDLKYVRMLGYLLMKIFSRIFQHIYYNSDMNENLQVMKHYPTLMLPLHRSYMDFLLVSIICFHKNVQLPAIAAGQDFLGLSFLSNVIRHTGAFFIRRSFGSDELYWAVFHQYVQEHLHNCDRPLEFFVEGTRSRTSKSLQPKQGMLSTCLELYLKGHRVEDIYIIPISLSYERLLEEGLYSRELLGIPKPKESVSGLVKARAILRENYGSIFVNFTRPVSVREMISILDGPTLKNRLSHTLTPGFIFELNANQNKSIESLSYLVLIEMLRQQVIQPISIIAACILLSFQHNEIVTGNNEKNNKQFFEWRRSLYLETLCYQLNNLKRILINLGAKVYWPLEEDTRARDADAVQDEQSFELNQLKNLILNNIESHSNLFDIHNLNEPVTKVPSSLEQQKFYTNLKLARSQSLASQQKNFLISIKQPHSSFNANITNINANLFESSSLYLAICSYRNQLVQFLVRISFVAMCLLGTTSDERKQPRDDSNRERVLGYLDEKKAFEMYRCLCRLFSKEFIFHVGDEIKDFNDSLSYLLHTNLIRIQATSKDGGERKFELVKFNMRIFFFFARSFLYIIQNYIEIYKILVDNNKNPVRLSFSDEKTFTKSIQTTLFEKMLNSLSSRNKESTDELYDFESLSLNLISNSLLCLKQFDILIKCDKSSYELDLVKLKRLNETLIFLVRTNRHKLRLLNGILKSFESENKLEPKFCDKNDMLDFEYFNYDDDGKFKELDECHFECFCPNNKLQNSSKL